MNYRKIIIYFVFLMTCHLAVAQVMTPREPSPEADALREAILDMMGSGTEQSLNEFKAILKDPEMSKLLSKGLDGPRRGARVIDKSIEIIGDRGTSESFQFLLNIAREDFSPSIEKVIFTPLLGNLLKFRETNRAEVLRFIEDELFFSKEDSDRLSGEYPFLEREDVFYDFQRNRYLNEQGNIVYQTKVNRDDARSGLLLRGLDTIGTETAYSMMAEYFSSWQGREDSAVIDNTQVHLKEKRYNLPIIDIYESLIQDQRYHPNMRASFVAHFFDNSADLYFGYIDDPEETFPQIQDASEEALLRILDVADYALTLKVLPMQTVDLVYKKRAEIIDRLVGMGYSREELSKAEAVKSVAGQVPSAVRQPEPTIEEPAEVAPVVETYEEPAEQSSQWWLWLIGAVIFVGGLSLVLRRKS